MSDYIPQKIEKRWQERWAKEGLYEPDLKKAKNPFYNLMMFPYPSGEGLHVGHVYAFSGSDTFGRFQKMQGKDVFEPMGFDAFGIHSENYALKKGKHPKELTKETTARYKKQLQKAGLGLDWSHKIDTTDPAYYKWTQWLFLQLYKNGLAERKKAPVNWCPSCKTVLADEQVISGKCERCDSEVTQKKLKQWFLKITDYAEKLDKNLDKIDWTPKVKKLQRNWIGRSEGAEIEFNVKCQMSNVKCSSIEVFTTRPDTLFGATFMVIAPEHKLAKQVAKENSEVRKYIKKAEKKTEQQRIEKEKSGVDTRLKAVNPATKEKIPIWVADFVLAHYGGGAVMGVPAHDQRDYEFAKRYNLPVREVIAPQNIAEDNAEKRRKNGDNQRRLPRLSALDEAYEGEGVLVNSGEFNGMDSEKAKEKITEKFGKKKVTYRLRDWLISRQRYWGPPIPIIYCDKCGQVPVPEEDLPVKLPEMEDFQPTGTKQAPLAHNEEFVNTTCPQCGGEAKRETHVSDNFLDSAWYFLRYPSTEFDDRAFDNQLTKKWLPVDMYIGGAEHAVLHLMYTRFITMALNDMGYIDFEEPFRKFRAHGLITKDGAKMSKSRGNVVNPDEYIDNFGADVFRMYLLFLGPFSQGGDFSDEGIAGTERFLKRVWEIAGNVKWEMGNEKGGKTSPELKKKLHHTIKKVTEDIESLKFNTAIAALMELSNEMSNVKCQMSNVAPFIKLLAPFAPHFTEEVWRTVWGNTESIFKEEWPKYDPELIKEDTFTLVIQVNGKVRGQVEAEKGISKGAAKELALQEENVKKYLEGKEIKRIIFVKNKLINLVV